MFGKKYIVKKVQVVGKSEAKRLRASASLAVGGQDFSDVMDALWDYRGTVSQQRWQFGHGASVFVYLVNEIPLLLSIDGLPTDADKLLPRAAVNGVVVPTLFFFLRARVLLADTPDRYAAFLEKSALSVFCRGQTSRYLLSGAHLMMPGICAVSTPVAQPGSLALVYSLGTDAPYAVGLVTTNLANKEATGAGVYVLNIFTDSLWREFETAFLVSCVDKSGKRIASPLPAEFHTDEVLENLSAAFGQGGESDRRDSGGAEDRLAAGDGPVSAAANGEEAEPVVDDNEAVSVEDASVAADGEVVGESVGRSAVNVEELFPDEDAVLSFALCEAVKCVQPSQLPIPLTQFTAFVKRSYPRVNSESQPVDFKKTKYKQALAFYHKYDELMEITEVSPGVHSLLRINKSAQVLREHKRRYKDFIEFVQQPAEEKESRAAEMRLLQDKKKTFDQTIVSVTTSYRARSSKGFPEGLAQILLVGNVKEVIASETAPQHYPSLEEVESCAPTLASAATRLPPVDEDCFMALYAPKNLVDNLRLYVKERGILVMPTGDAKVPTVKLQGALEGLAAGAPDDGIEITKLSSIILDKYFLPFTEIVIQTNVSGSSAMSEVIAPRHVLKAGLGPTISLWTESRAGNKVLTICKNLEALGFNLEALSRAWSKRFATSSSVVDPAVGMSRLKSGTKIPQEIHLQGDVKSRLAKHLVSDLGVPADMIRYSR